MSTSRKLVLFGLCLCFDALYTEADLGVDKNVVIANCVRSIDLKSQLVKENLKLTFKNTNEQSVESVYFAFDSNESKSLMSVAAKVKGDGSKLKPLNVKLSENNGNNDAKKDLPAVLYEITLLNDLQSGSSIEVTVDVIMVGQSHRMHMFPANITQGQDQLTLYMANVLLFSPYEVLKQSTNILLPSSSVISFDLEDHRGKSLLTKADSTIKFGPTTQLEKPYANRVIKVHFKNPNLFCNVRKLTRTIYVSMWGKISVEETMDISNTGARLVGPFSRLDYDMYRRGGRSRGNIFLGYTVSIPKGSTGIYQRDDIGIIWTHSSKVKGDSVEVSLSPRFPVMGGWKTHYTFGYSVPSAQYVTKRSGSGKYTLNMRLIDNIFADMVIEDAEVRIILPEGALVSHVKTPYPTQRLGDERFFSAFDVKGRPLITFKNLGVLGEKHIKNLRVDFALSASDLYLKPLVIIFAFFIVFMAACFAVRINYSIITNHHSETLSQLTALLKNLLIVQNCRRKEVYVNVDAAIARVKTSRDLTSFENELNKCTECYKDACKKVNELTEKINKISDNNNVVLAGDSPFDYRSPIQQLVHLDKSLREVQNNHCKLVRQLIDSGEISRDQFVEQENILMQKKDNLLANLKECYMTISC